MKLIEKDGIFLLESTYQEKAIPQGASFRWNPAIKQWWTDDIKKAANLAAYADDSLRVKFQLILDEKKKSIEESKASNAVVEIPKPDGLEYLPYQKAGIVYGINRQNVLIGDDMGLGKTIQAIGICNSDQSIKNILIICPASLRLNWKREFEKWDIKKLTIGIAIYDFPITNVCIVNYDVLKKFHEQIRKLEWDAMIVDEAHYLKSGKAQRTHEVFGSKEIKKIEAKRKIFLTGTPIPNRPAEAWTLAHNLAPDTFKSWKYFVERYAQGHRTKFGWDISGSSNLDELQEKLRTSIMVRRLKIDVLKELPAKRRQVVELYANEATEIVKREKTAWKIQQEKLDDLKLAVELAKSDSKEAYTAAIQNLHEGSGVAFIEMAKLRHETALAKVPYIINHIEDSLENGKIVVFAHHKDVIAKIKEAFPQAVVVTGDVSMENRQKAIDSFQNAPNANLFIGNIQAAGVGLTLTASAHVIFAELDWVPGNMTQAEDRCHRIGQVNSVLIQHLVLEDSIDVDIARTLINKQIIIEQALDKGKELQMILPEKIEHIAATEAITFEEVKKEAISMDEKEIGIIHAALRIISSLCDGATALDGCGFNKMDTNIGHSLARQTKLSPKQAVLGKRLATKYRRQLPEELKNNFVKEKK